MPPPSPHEPANPQAADNHRWFTEQVYHHESPLRAWLRGRFPWVLDVDDVVQESFLRLWRRRQRTDVPPIQSPKALLFATARNMAIDQRRHQAVAKTDSVADLAPMPVLDNHAPIEQTIAAREELEFLAEAIRRLPDRCRQVLTLAKIYGMTEREVAEKLGVSESTVRTHVEKGLKDVAVYLRRRGVERKSR